MRVRLVAIRIVFVGVFALAYVACGGVALPDPPLAPAPPSMDAPTAEQDGSVADVDDASSADADDGGTADAADDADDSAVQCLPGELPLGAACEDAGRCCGSLACKPAYGTMGVHCCIEPALAGHGTTATCTTSKDCCQLSCTTGSCSFCRSGQCVFSPVP